MENTIKLAKIQLNVSTGILLNEVSGQVIKLPKKLFELLHYLMLNDGLYITRERLLKEIWLDTPIKKRSVDNHIPRLRKLVGNHIIQTSINRGYRFDSNYYTRKEREKC